MPSRMQNPAVLLPDAMKALLALHASIERVGVSEKTLGLVHLRASQLNGCSVCLAMHARTMKEKLGETDERSFAVAAWRDTPYFTEAERAALALTEEVTRLDGRDPVPDAVWNDAKKHYDSRALAALVLAIASVNVWNRLNVATRQLVGEQEGWGV